MSAPFAITLQFTRTHIIETGIIKKKYIMKHSRLFRNSLNALIQARILNEDNA